MGIEYENLDDYPLLGTPNGTNPPPPQNVTKVEEVKKDKKKSKSKSKSAETTSDEVDWNNNNNGLKKNNRRKTTRTCWFYLIGLFLVLGAGVALGCGGFFLLHTHNVASEDVQKYGHAHSTHHPPGVTPSAKVNVAPK